MSETKDRFSIPSWFVTVIVALWSILAVVAIPWVAWQTRLAMKLDNVVVTNSSLLHEMKATLKTTREELVERRSDATTIRDLREEIRSLETELRALRDRIARVETKLNGV